jgi:hypothetical protein
MKPHFNSRIELTRQKDHFPNTPSHFHIIWNKTSQIRTQTKRRMPQLFEVNKTPGTSTTATNSGLQLGSIAADSPAPKRP